MPTRRRRDDWAAAPPDDGGNLGVFSRPEDELTRSGSGTERPIQERRSDIERSSRAPILAVLIVVILLVAAVLLFV